MDRNMPLGNMILNSVLCLLRYLPSPSIDINNQFLISQSQEGNQPTYTIGLLNVQARHYWIQTLQIILYKVVFFLTFQFFCYFPIFLLV
jgi:hypothetical protein